MSLFFIDPGFRRLVRPRLRQKTVSRVIVSPIVGILSIKLTSRSPHAFETDEFILTTMNLYVSFTWAAACEVVPLLYGKYTCELLVQDSLCIAYPDVRDLLGREPESRTLTLSEGVDRMPDKCC
jgi:hypothetical protein